MGCLSRKKYVPAVEVEVLEEPQTLKENTKSKSKTKTKTNKKSHKSTKKTKHIEQEVSHDMMEVICLHDYLPLDLEELECTAHSRLIIEKKDFNSSLDYIIASVPGVESVKKGYVPRIFLVEKDSPEAIPGYKSYTRRQAEDNIIPGTFIIRPPGHMNGSQVFSVTTCEANGPKKHFKVEKFQNYIYFHDERYNDVNEMINFLQSINFQPFIGEPPKVALRIKLDQIDKTKLVKVKNLGRGNFGEVNLYNILNASGAVSQKVAGKTLHFGDNKQNKNNPNLEEKQLEVMEELKKEIIIHEMASIKGNCIYVVKVLSASLNEYPPLMLIEFVEGGSVKDALQNRLIEINYETFYIFYIQLFSGLKYLHQDSSHSHAIVHLDLACRNLMIEISKSVKSKEIRFTIKIGDFGCSRLVVNKEEAGRYPGVPLSIGEDRKSAKLPVRHSAPEVVYSRILTPVADCWSAAMAGIEFATGGEVPLKNYDNEAFKSKFLQVFKEVQSIHNPSVERPKLPDTIHDKLKPIVQSLICHYSVRPASAMVLRNLLNNNINDDAGYNQV